jgi:hypothetical protein
LHNRALAIINDSIIKLNVKTERQQEKKRNRDDETVTDALRKVLFALKANICLPFFSAKIRNDRDDEEPGLMVCSSQVMHMSVWYKGAQLAVELRTSVIWMESLEAKFAQVHNVFNDPLPTVKWFDLKSVLSKYEMLKYMQR